MKRFLKVFILLIVGLFFIASGVDAALDHYTRATAQNSVSICDAKGATLFAYNGDLNECKAFAKPVIPVYLHRT